MTTKESNSQKNGLYLFFTCWAIAMISTLASLFFSEVMKFPPCTLCWYQRICMYPLVIIFAIGMCPLDKVTFRFAAPFVGAGWFFSVYHNLLHYKIIPESAAPCSMGISCSTVYINWFGFLTIPMLSFISFSILSILMIIFYRRYIK